MLNDLTTGGAGLKINQFFVVGDIIQIRFSFEDEETVLEASVANVNGKSFEIVLA